MTVHGLAGLGVHQGAAVGDNAAVPAQAPLNIAPSHDTPNGPCTTLAATRVGHPNSRPGLLTRDILDSNRLWGAVIAVQSTLLAFTWWEWLR